MTSPSAGGVEWSVRDRLILVSAIQHHGVKDWTVISQSIQPLVEDPTSLDYYSQLNCALQYAAIAEKAGVKQGSDEDVPGVCETIIRRLREERIEEINKSLSQIKSEYQTLTKEVELLEKGELDYKIPLLLENLTKESNQNVPVSKSPENPPVTSSPIEPTHIKASPPAIIPPDNKPKIPVKTEPRAPTKELVIKKELTSPTELSVPLLSGLSDDKTPMQTPHPTSSDQPPSANLHIIVQQRNEAVDALPVSATEASSVVLPVVSTVASIASQAPSVQTSVPSLPVKEPLPIESTVVTITTPELPQAIPSISQSVSSSPAVMSSPTPRTNPPVVTAGTSPLVSTIFISSPPKKPSTPPITPPVMKMSLMKSQSTSPSLQIVKLAPPKNSPPKSVSVPCQSTPVPSKPLKSTSLSPTTKLSPSASTKTEMAIKDWVTKVSTSVDTPEDKPVENPDNTAETNDESTVSSEVMTTPIKEESPNKQEGTGSTPGTPVISPLSTADSATSAAMETTDGDLEEDTPTKFKQAKSMLKRSLLTRSRKRKADDDGPSVESTDTEEDGFSSQATSTVASPAPSQSSEMDADAVRAHKHWKKGIMIVWRHAAQHKYANFFLHPVKPDDAPGYKDVILCPTDLSTIKRKVESGLIKTDIEFQREMLLMFQNAFMYNSSDHEVYQIAQTMKSDVMENLQTYLAAQAQLQLLEDPIPTKTLRGRRSDRDHDDSLSSPSVKKRRTRNDDKTDQ